MSKKPGGNPAKRGSSGRVTPKGTQSQPRRPVTGAHKNASQRARVTGRPSSAARISKARPPTRSLLTAVLAELDALDTKRRSNA